MMQNSRINMVFRVFFLNALVFLAVCLVTGCASPKIRLFTDHHEPLEEFILAGNGEDKVVVIPIAGFITDVPGFSFISPKASMLQEVVSQLRKAERDPKVKAVVFKINSPGGTVTASDIIYHEILQYKLRSKVTVVAELMDIATSGGYYAALPADYIMGHPCSVTGSVGVIFLQPKFYGLMDKIGVEMEVVKFGKDKDMGSPFRKTGEREKKIFQGIIDLIGKKFIGAVEKHRKLTPEGKKEVASARVFLAPEAKKAGMIDGIGYINDAVAKARELARIPHNARIIVYRRSFYPDDNLYNTAINSYDGGKISLVDLGVFSTFANMPAGFYYLWPQAVGSKY